MQDFPYVLSECEEINSLIYKPIYSTQRIKYTCFGVSPSYIILGSTSGSLYLFAREPCTFQQLIPLSEGAVTHVSISPDEKTIALTTVRGTVCLVSLKPCGKLLAVSSEHVSEQITCLCWNDNSSEVYIGDVSGKVSVVMLSIFTVNGMFQAPACMLMNLDSSIVQLSYASPLLVVSTLTRCYICDTIREQYKQIGNKARNGHFGACFLKAQASENKRASITQNEEKTIRAKSSFSLISESENNISEENSPKIFCARPGARLWEISANGVVMKTHQFKEALGVPPTVIYNPNKTEQTHQKQTDQTVPLQPINFSHLFVVAQKYLFSSTTTGLYVLDPINTSVVLWCNEYLNVAMLDVVDNKIYLMTCDSKFHCLTLCSIDSLILRFYNNKQYYTCLDVCTTYKFQLLKSINNKEISEICNLNDKPQVLQNSEASEILLPLISLLQSNVNKTPIKLDSGIVVVNAGNVNSKCEENDKLKMIHKSCDSLTINKELSETKKLIRTKDPSISTTESVESESIVSNVNENYLTHHDIDASSDLQEGLERTKISSELIESINATQKVQIELNPVYMLINSIKSSMTEGQIEEIISDIEERMNNVRSSYENFSDLKNFMYEMIRSVELYYFNVLLENVSLELLCSTNSNCIVKQFAKSFVNVNMDSYDKCSCNFPCTMDELSEPKFLEIGRVLLKKLVEKNKEECMHICDRVPYMWRDYLSLYISQQYNLSDILRQCLQIGDSIVLSRLLPLLDTKEWESMTIYLKNVQNGKCLFCGTTIRNNLVQSSTINWNDIMHEIMKNDGPNAVMAFLTRLETSIPNFSFDKSIFQSIIFTKILEHHGMKHVVDFNKSNPEISEYSTMCSTKIQDQLAVALEKDLGRPINKNIFGTGAHHWGMRYQSNSSSCPCCTLSLQTPVLLGNNGIAIFSCGHAYHVNCMIEKKLTKCNLHS